LGLFDKNFYILLAAHLSIILAIDQLNTQILVLLISLLYSSTCFEHNSVRINFCPSVACGRTAQFLYVPVLVNDHKPKCRRIIETVHVRVGINVSFLRLFAHIILLFGHALILL